MQKQKNSYLRTWPHSSGFITHIHNHKQWGQPMEMWVRGVHALMRDTCVYVCVWLKLNKGNRILPHCKTNASFSSRWTHRRKFSLKVSCWPPFTEYEFSYDAVASARTLGNSIGRKPHFLNMLLWYFRRLEVLGSSYLNVLRCYQGIAMQLLNSECFFFFYVTFSN